MAAGAVAQEAVAEAAEFVSEESAQVAEATRALSSRDVGFLFGGVGVGVGIGVGAAYLILSKKLELKYEDLADEEIANMKEHYNAKLRALDARSEKETLGKIVEDNGYKTDTVKDPREPLGKVAYHDVGSEPEKTKDITDINVVSAGPVTQNVFDTPPIEVEEEVNVYELERDPEVPYVIHKDEHHETPEGYEQYTLTYFEGDDILSDERDRVLTEQDEVIGLGNLSRFGQGSGDPNIVYIRNEKLKVDIELVHSDGKFATEVHGFQDDELQHSSMRRRSPRRSDYDPDR